MRSSFLRCCLLLALLFQMISCAGAPGPVVIERPLRLNPGDTRCLAPFPDGEWQLVHSIHVALSGVSQTTLVGVTALDSMTGAVACVLMTVEGMVLFDARYDGEIHSRRSLPPFDSVAFARGLINDIRLMFFPPDGRLVASGRSGDGAFICRYRTADSMTVDVVVHEDNGWEIRQYDRDDSLIRSLKTDPDSRPAEKGPIPSRLKLTASGPAEYALTLDLIEAWELGK